MEDVFPFASGLVDHAETALCDCGVVEVVGELLEELYAADEAGEGLDAAQVPFLAGMLEDFDERREGNGKVVIVLAA